MPIKLPKIRRKSSGNVLEDLAPPEPSFRVLERPPSKSFEGPGNLRRYSQARPMSAGNLIQQTHGAGSDTLGANNRSSGATNNSASSGGQDNYSFSAGYGSSSTLPSSTDTPVDDRFQPKHSFTVPIPPVPESTGIASLKAAGRAFSFGRKKAEGTQPDSRPVIEHTHSDGIANYARERTFTGTSYASESTATPPKLLETGLNFGSTENFGLMFENYGKRASQIELGNLALMQGQKEEQRSAAVEIPNTSEKSKDRNLTSSPVSYNAQDSLGTSLAGPTLPMERTFSYEGAEEKMDLPRGPSKSKTAPVPGAVAESSPLRPTRPPSAGLRRSSAYAKPLDARRSSTPLDDDADLVLNSIAVGRRLDRAASAGYHDSDEDDNPAAFLVPPSRQTPSPHVTAGAQQYARVPTQTPSPDISHNRNILPSNNWRPQSTYALSPAKQLDAADHDEGSLFDSRRPVADEASRTRPAAAQPPLKLQTQNKVMTPTQFEKYRREQEMNRAANPSNDPDGSDSEEDNYEDDDEIETSKQAAKDRQRQQAHLAVYRQQMMKITGEQHDAPGLQLRPKSSSPSMPNLRHSPSPVEINFDGPSDDGKGGDDEDEEVPLGVLAAHGFPSKNRPPTAMSGRESRIQYKSESYPAPPASVSSASQAGRASGLPPFAKNLPQDPYYGASLVNPSNRESIAHRRQGSPNPAEGQPNIPPAGLVGVIADEERARAARRGSPNAQAGYGAPLPPGVGQMPGMPPGLPPMMSPSEQATVQMSEQMSQMMHMQMQWMQQMQQMMASGMQFPPGQQMPMMPGQPPMMPPAAMSPMQGPPQRPTSSGPYLGPGPVGGPAPNGRAMSMMSPPPNWQSAQPANRKSTSPRVSNGISSNANQSYAPSIAPSERSNVGMPSRYRPVSIAPADEHQGRAYSRSSTMNSNTLHVGASTQGGRLSNSRERKSNFSLRPVSRAVSKQAGSDDDDEEGWAEMKQKRDKKKGMWRLNRKKEEPAEPGLEYYDYNGAVGE